MFPVVVSVRSISIRYPPRPRRASEPAPGPAVLPQQGIGAGRAVRPGRVLLGLVVRRPEVLDRVENLPGQLDLLLAREQWRVTDQHVEQQPLVRLRARFGERLAV